MKVVVWVFCIGAGLFLTVMIVGSLAPDDIKAVNNAELAVKQHLRDPSSAKFGKAVFRNGVVCGTVNARNGFGGYSGEISYIVLSGGQTLIRDEISDQGFDLSWADFCIDAPANHREAPRSP